MDEHRIPERLLEMKLSRKRPTGRQLIMDTPSKEECREKRMRLE
jgi:hypothetical protein